MEKLELRFIDAQMQSIDDGLKVSGYVNKTNQWSQELGQRKKFVERILPGTFTRAIDNGNEIHFLAEHDNAKILASTRNGSLSLREDDQGLWMEARISETSWGKDYYTLIKDGIIRNMSFGMGVLKDSWKKLSDGTYERSISDLYLAEVSAVRNPAYVQSTIAARSIEVVEDVEPHDVEDENENREESNQMENLEYRDKLIEAIEGLTALVQQMAPKPEPIVEKAPEPVVEQPKIEPVVKPVKEETPKTEEPAPVVEKEKPKVEEVPAVEPVKEEKPAEEPVKEEAPVSEPEKAPDLTEFYKKLLDLA